MLKQRKVNEPTRHNSVIINICFESGDLKKMWKWGKWRIPLRSKVSVNRRKWIRTEGSDRVVSHQKVASFADFHRVCVQWNCDIDLLEWPSQKESASGFFLAADQFCFYLRRRWRSILLLPLSPPPPKGKKTERNQRCTRRLQIWAGLALGSVPRGRWPAPGHTRQRSSHTRAHILSVCSSPHFCWKEMIHQLPDKVIELIF